MFLFNIVQSHLKDQECFPRRGETTIRKLRARNFAILDIAHIYINAGGIESTRKEERVILNQGENKTITFFAHGYSKFNPRELFLTNDNGNVKASMGLMDFFYNSVLVESKIDWTCWNSSLNSDSSASVIFSTNGEYRHEKFSYLRDRVEIMRLSNDVLLGDEQDKQCFEMMFPEMKNANAMKSAKTLFLNISHLHTVSNTGGSWTTVKQNQTVTIQDGVKQVMEFTYYPRNEAEYGDHNPRNLTILYQNSQVYLGMARQKEYDFYWNHWTHEVSFLCFLITDNHYITRYPGLAMTPPSSFLRGKERLSSLTSMSSASMLIHI